MTPEADSSIEDDHPAVIDVDEDPFEQAELAEALESIPDHEINEVSDEVLEAVFEDMSSDLPAVENL